MKNRNFFSSIPPKQGLYDPANEHDSCGVGFVAHIKGDPSHQILLDAKEILRNMDVVPVVAKPTRATAQAF